MNMKAANVVNVRSMIGQVLRLRRDYSIQSCKSCKQNEEQVLRVGEGCLDYSPGCMRK